MTVNGQNKFHKPVAIDAMGGDKGPAVVVEGAVQAYQELGLSSILVGPEAELKALLSGFGADAAKIQIKHAAEVITMDDSATRAVRKKPNSSLCEAFRLVQSGEASAVMSTGNSGALMAAGVLMSGTLPGIERPAIATLIPVAREDKPNVILDAGANVECNASHLLQFAIMGSIYCSTLLDVSKPKVALLSNGSEPSKGTDITRSARLALENLENINFIGYVEGRDVPTKVADVIVCDGFVGNIVLKTMEGCARLISDQILYASRKGPIRTLGIMLLRGLLKETFRERFDYSSYGGAPLLGLNHLALVLHGSSGARAVKNAVRVAGSFEERKMIERIAQDLAQVEDQISEPVDGLFVGSDIDISRRKSNMNKSKRKNEQVPDGSEQ